MRKSVKKNIFIASLAIISLTAFALGGIKQFPESSLWFGKGSALRELVFDHNNSPSSAKISVDPAFNQFNFNRKINGNDVDLTGKLRVLNTGEGSIPCPVMTEVQRDAIVTKVEGDCVYDSTNKSYSIYDGTDWIGVGGGLDKWTALKGYKTDNVVWNPSDRKIYRGLSDFTSGATFTPGNWEEIGIESLQELYEANNILTLVDAVGGVKIIDDATEINDSLFAVTDNTGVIPYLDVSKDRTLTTDIDGERSLRKESGLLFFEDFKKNLPSTLYTVTGTAIVVDDNTNRIEGKISAKVTQVSGNGGSLITSDPIALEKIALGRTLGFYGDYFYSGNTNDVFVNIYQSDDNVSYDEVATISLAQAINSKEIQLMLQFRDTATHWKYEFELSTENIGAILDWKNIKLSTRAMPTTEFVESDSIRLQTGNGYGSTNTHIRRFSNISLNGDLTVSPISASQDSSNGFMRITSSGTSGTEIEILKEAIYDIGYYDEATSGATDVGISLNSNQLSTSIALIDTKNRIANDTSATANYSANPSVSIRLKVGDVIRMHTDSSANATGDADVFITATRKSSNVVFKGQEQHGQMVRYNGNPSTTTGNLVTWSGIQVESIGSDITPDANHGLFTVNESGYYSVNSTVISTSLGQEAYIQKNTATQVSRADPKTLSVGQNQQSNGYDLNMSWTGWLDKNDTVGVFYGSAIISSSSNLTISRTDAPKLNSIPVTDEVENVYSAKIDAIGVVSDENTKWITSTSYAAGITTLNLAAGIDGLTLKLAPVSSNQNVQAVVVEANRTATSIDVLTQVSSSLALGQFPFHVIAQRGSDYKAPQGHFLGNMPLSSGDTIGTEYWTGRKLGGKKVYARTYDIGTLPASNYLVDTITGIGKIIPDGIKTIGGRTDNNEYYSYLNTVLYGYFDTDTNALRVQVIGISYKDIVITIQYTK